MRNYLLIYFCLSILLFSGCLKDQDCVADLATLPILIEYEPDSRYLKVGDTLQVSLTMKDNIVNQEGLPFDLHEFPIAYDLNINWVEGDYNFRIRSFRDASSSFDSDTISGLPARPQIGFYNSLSRGLTMESLTEGDAIVLKIYPKQAGDFFMFWRILGSRLDDPCLPVMKPEFTMIPSENGLAELFSDQPSLEYDPDKSSHIGVFYFHVYKEETVP